MAQYAEITESVAPGSAEAGSIVSIQVKIKNKYSATISIMAVAFHSEQPTGEYITGLYPNKATANVSPGATYTFSGYFTMPYFPPGKEIIIHAYSYWYGSDSAWHSDDQKNKTVVTVAPVDGTITKKDLEYDSARAAIPASNIPKGKSGLVHVWGRNDTTSAQRMGINWVLIDPDGLARETYSAWEAWPYTPAGDDHEFIGDRFSLDKVGTWKINVQLNMNPDNPTIVDSYSGTLCTVTPSQPEISQFQIVDFVKV